MSYDKSTGVGQKRLFYEVQQQVAETIHEKMARLAYDNGYEDGTAGHTPKTPGNADYMRGHKDGTPLP